MTTTIERPGTTVGRGVDRVDGPKKVTGAALYAADAPVTEPLHAVLVQSTIARGRIREIDERDARTVPGVVEILSYRNAPRLKPTGFSFQDGTAFCEEGALPLQLPDVFYWGQIVAVVVARTFEAARAAAQRVRVAYDLAPAAIAFDEAAWERAERAESFFGSPLHVERGDADAALAASATTIDATYTTPIEHHTPLEPHATVAQWDGDELTVHDSTQWIMGARTTLAHLFGLPVERVRVICPFIGGAFGSKGFLWPPPVVAALAARAVGKAVKLAVDRSHSFSTNGHRSETRQHVRLAAARDGALSAIVHDVVSSTSEVGEFHEAANRVTQMLYATPNLRTSHRTVRLDVATPTAMRAPGEAPGTFALESALDELAAELRIDPIELRVRNHTDVEPGSGLPFSSKHLLECYRAGAKRFGWERRSAVPRGLREGGEFVGYGMATATYPALVGAAEVRVRVEAGGRVAVECATHDLGTGMYTIATQVAADALGLPLERVDVRIGDSQFPPAPVAGGSQSTASVMPAIAQACAELRRLAGGTIGEGNVGLEAGAGNTGELDEEHYAFHSFGAQFCEVRYDEALARVRVTRFTGVFDCGRILNAKTARSQMIGGIVMGLGMALIEESIRDERSGAWLTHNFADYHVPVNADVPPIDIAFVEVPDTVFNVLGARGVGEIGITGVAAAVANAIYNASGKRMRDLPILPEKLL